MEEKRILIAPIGGKDTNAAAALELLLQMGKSIDEVVILHVSGNLVIDEALNQIRAEFSTLSGIHLQVKPFRRGARTIQNLDTEEEIDTLLFCLYNEVRQAKNAGAQVHMLCSNGRELIAAYAMLTAQLLFNEEDSLWYLVSQGSLQEARDDSDGRQPQLLKIPFLRWSAVLPAFAELKTVKDPKEAFQKLASLQMEEKYHRAQTFIEAICTPGERDVLRPAVTAGLSNAQIAQNLGLSERTVESHMRSILKKASQYWKDSRLNRVALTILILPYYQLKITEE